MIISEQKNKCIKVEVQAIEPRGEYTLYVMKDLVTTDDSQRYIMCTKCPNWNGKEISIGQTGFMTYASIVAGVDKWYNRIDGQHYDYKYTANYFLNFVPITHVVLGGRVVKQQELIVT